MNCNEQHQHRRDRHSLGNDNNISSSLLRLLTAAAAVAVEKSPRFSPPNTILRVNDSDLRSPAPKLSFLGGLQQGLPVSICNNFLIKLYLLSTSFNTIEA